jgi:C_GCAxxG_C_C family probable redox protein
MQPKILAQTYFEAGFLCSQSILMAYGRLFNLDRDLAARLAAPYGGGVARRGETCGAVNGACMVLGLKYGHTEADDADSKERTYQAVKDFITKFRDSHGSIQCRQLLDLNINTPEGLEMAHEAQLFTTRCPEFVSRAAELLDEFIAD